MYLSTGSFTFELTFLPETPLSEANVNGTDRVTEGETPAKPKASGKEGVRNLLKGLGRLGGEIFVSASKEEMRNTQQPTQMPNNAAMTQVSADLHAARMHAMALSAGSQAQNSVFGEPGTTYEYRRKYGPGYY
jgi:hypothetical protein